MMEAAATLVIPCTGLGKLDVHLNSLCAQGSPHEAKWLRSPAVASEATLWLFMPVRTVDHCSGSLQWITAGRQRHEQTPSPPSFLPTRVFEPSSTNDTTKMAQDAPIRARSTESCTESCEEPRSGTGFARGLGFRMFFRARRNPKNKSFSKFQARFFVHFSFC